MYTANMAKNDIEAAELMAWKASNELNAIRDTAPDWKIDSLEELIEDALDARDNLKEILREWEHGQLLAKGLCPTCDSRSDMPGSYCSDCQQSAGERMGGCQ